VFEDRGVQIVIDPKSLVYLDGTELDFVKEGLNDEMAHSSIRFSVGRFTTEEEVDYAVAQIRDAVGKLRELSPLWDMFKDGVDLSKVEWVHH